MARMSGPKRKKLYQRLVLRDGECCYIGGEPGNSKTLVIDHADNDHSNDALANLHLFCRSMNQVKNPRGRGHKMLSSVCVCVCEGLAELESNLTISAEFKKNQQAEPDFRHWLFAEVWRKGSLSLDDAIDCGAAVAHCSQETIKRYIRKECSRVRPYQVIEDVGEKKKLIKLRSDWQRHREKEVARRNLDRHAKNWRRATGKTPSPRASVVKLAATN